MAGELANSAVRWRKGLLIGLSTAAVVAVGTVAYLLVCGAGKTERQREVSTATAGPTAAKQVFTVHVAVSPPNATVRVDAEERSLTDGKLELRGHPGKSFMVVVAYDLRAMKSTVVISKDGKPLPARLELTAAATASGTPKRPAPITD